MKEYPILFNGEMVRTILEGRKTQTRRPIKPQPFWKESPPDKLMSSGWQWSKGKILLEGWPDWDAFAKKIASYCPFGQPGDQLWVRETWCPYPEEGTGRIWYRATDERSHDRWRDNSKIPKHLYDWRPSIHMPREASRITLEIDEIRVKRIWDITTADAKAEGITETQDVDYISPFVGLWNSIYLKQGLDWEANPWVWVVEFHGVEKVQG